MPDAFRAGAAQTCITPNLGCHLEGNWTDRLADHIHDDLYAKAFVLDNGATRLGIVVADLIMVSREMADETKRLVTETVGIPADHLLVTATHTHYGPSIFGALGTPAETEYCRAVPRRLADALILAERRLQPAQLGWAFGACPTEVRNRRWRMKDGSVHTNPGYQHPDLVEPVGPTDPTLPVMILRTPERRPIGVLANLGLHYVGSGNTDISSDYFGEFGRALQRCAGAEFVCAMTNGCFGDINNVDFSRPPPVSPHPYHRLERVANVCAGEAWKTWNTLWEEDYSASPALGAALRELDIVPRRPTPEQLATAEEYLAEHTVEDDLMTWMYQHEYVLMADSPAVVRLPLQALRIGDVGLVGLPGAVELLRSLA
ncbi:MAG: hypothetical protein HYU66_18715 [Armatimonadetes bacterium]|nr:hypothetical protein [Armatimonadota bacterium]